MQAVRILQRDRILAVHAGWRQHSVSMPKLDSAEVGGASSAPRQTPCAPLRRVQARAGCLRCPQHGVPVALGSGEHGAGRVGARVERAYTPKMTPSERGSLSNICWSVRSQRSRGCSVASTLFEMMLSAAGGWGSQQS